MPGRADSFAFAVSFVRALKSKLLATTDLDMILKSKDEVDAIRVLSDTVYAPYVSRFVGKPFVIKQFEDAIQESYHDDYARVIRATASATARNALMLMHRKHELNCLKIVLKCVMEGVPAEQAKDIITPMGEYTYERCLKLLKMKDLGMIAEDIKDRKARKVVLDSLPESKKLGSTIPLEASIDKYYYTMIWNLTQRLPQSDKAPVENILGMEIDTANLGILIRGKEAEIPVSHLERFMLPIRHRFAIEFEQAMNAPTAGDALRILSSGFYGVVLQRAAEAVKSAGSLFPVEVATKRYLASKNLSLFTGYPFHAGTLLAYLNLKLYETQDIRGMVLGKRDGMAGEKIRDFLITYGLS